VAHHISAGMYGLILVEPKKGLPRADKEFYVMQGDLYTSHPAGTKGHHAYSQDRASDELPTFYTFNGAVGALTKEHKMTAKVGETVRVYFGVGGPNKVSSFHVIGEIFDKVYSEGSLRRDHRGLQGELPRQLPAGGPRAVARRQGIGRVARRDGPGGRHRLQGEPSRPRRRRALISFNT
jgi:nitrite reductase (NO-forming)